MLVSQLVGWGLHPICQKEVLLTCRFRLYDLKAVGRGDFFVNLLYLPIHDIGKLGYPC